jgi:hypothetical protein
MINNQFVSDQFEWKSDPSGLNWSILSGFATTDENLGWFADSLKGFDLRAVRNSLNWNLAWYGADFVDTSRTSTFIDLGNDVTQQNWLHNEETYTIGLHRKSDGNVDIYFTGNVYKASDDSLVQSYNNELVATMPLIDGVNPGGLIAGDYTQSAIGGKMMLDSVKIGVAEVPEPASSYLIAMGLGSVVFRRKKQKDNCQAA